MSAPSKNRRQNPPRPDKRARRHDDPAAFPIPISGLFADLELGIGALGLPDDFFAVSGAVQIEIIVDWQRALEQTRRRALMQLYTEATASFEGLSVAEKIERFRVTCQSLNIDCGNELADLVPPA